MMVMDGLKPGDRVYLTKSHRSWGVVELISHCGRYALVRRRYGEDRFVVWPYYVRELEVVGDDEDV